LISSPDAPTRPGSARDPHADGVELELACAEVDERDEEHAQGDARRARSANELEGVVDEERDDRGVEQVLRARILYVGERSL